MDSVRVRGHVFLRASHAGPQCMIFCGRGLRPRNGGFQPPFPVNCCSRGR